MITSAENILSIKNSKSSLNILQINMGINYVACTNVLGKRGFPFPVFL